MRGCTWLDADQDTDLGCYLVLGKEINMVPVGCPILTYIFFHFEAKGRETETISLPFHIVLQNKNNNFHFVSLPYTSNFLLHFTSLFHFLL